MFGRVIDFIQTLSPYQRIRVMCGSTGGVVETIASYFINEYMEGFDLAYSYGNMSVTMTYTDSPMGADVGEYTQVIVC